MVLKIRTPRPEYISPGLRAHRVRELSVDGPLHIARAHVLLAVLEHGTACVARAAPALVSTRLHAVTVAVGQTQLRGASRAVPER